MVNDNEEASAVTHDIAAAAQPSTIDDETQPLLSESAIRSRYTDSANEFARSFIEQSISAGCQDPESLTQSGGLSFDPAENVVTVVQSDSSDSGIESIASGSESDVDDSLAYNPREPSVVLPCDGDGDGSNDESGSLVEYCDPVNEEEHTVEPDNESGLVSDTVSLTHFATRTPSDSSAHYTNTPSVERRDRSATICTKRASKDTAVAPAPSSAGGRPRSSTLNVQAKAFVPTVLQHASASPNRSRNTSTGGSQELTGTDDGASAASVSAAPAEITPDEPAGGQATATPVVNRRCRFWPSCSNKNCKYTHPSQTCRMHPNCAFGANCIYIHPSDMNKINAVATRGNGRRSKRKNNELIRYNNLEAFVAE
ncbi:hypothetical protein LPJ59_002286 [Coemansia sp. RSA 2399]|nr:hypothetical protein LPJ59_002286 [Coemansia sp. RSA 2399]